MKSPAQVFLRKTKLLQLELYIPGLFGRPDQVGLCYQMPLLAIGQNEVVHLEFICIQCSLPVGAKRFLGKVKTFEEFAPFCIYIGRILFVRTVEDSI